MRELASTSWTPDPSLDRIAAAVGRIGAAGRASFPAIVLADSAIAQRLARMLHEDPGAQLEALHDADVYLAIALAAGIPEALCTFEDTLVPQMTLALRRLRIPNGVADDVKQALRVELLVDGPSPGSGARIADYAGRGELAAWLRVTATRKALKLARRAQRDEELDELALDQWPGATPDPERTHIRNHYADELKRALAEAFAALDVRQRNLLRQHVIDDLTIDDLARLYQVHRATCARWLADARAELGRGTRKRLVATLRAPAVEVDSLLRFLDSDIELSISRIMHTR